MVKNVADVNANATEASMSARGIDTVPVPPEAMRETIEVLGIATLTKPRTFPMTWRAIARKQEGSS